MRKIEGRAIKTKYIEVQGQFGQFDIASKKIKVRYFSTFASGKNALHDSFNLLKELKPMRERIKAKDISDLDSLLQRDLNDFRVASELIPYLIDDKIQVAFFPAILAVLIPKGFLSQKNESSYPIGEIQNSKHTSITSYGDMWKTEIFRIDEQESSLGILSINPNQTDVVVLDGQHRANAFRVVTGTFENEKNSIYSSFYNQLDPIEGFNADLPVTIMWFENSDPKFDPKIVSRRLFVDVNNTAKRVSQSRTILLDEYEVPSLLTRFFYSKLAEDRQFNTGKFSLFHSDFDLDSDINVSSNSAFAITNPQIIHDIFSWLVLGRTDRYSELSKYSVSREAFRNATDRFGEIFNSSEFSDKDVISDDESLNRKRVIIKDIYKIEPFKKIYKEVLSPVMLKVFSDFSFYKPHFLASAQLNKEYEANEMDHLEMTVWEDVFLGGEGLYYTFKDQNILDAENPSLNKYKKTIDQIESRFRKIRSEYYENIDQKKIDSAYNSANSKAFQIGLFLAMNKLKGDNTFAEFYEDFLISINSKSAEDWVYILTDIRQKVLRGTDPKKWPGYQKLIIRTVDKDYSFYDTENYLFSPDGLVFKSLIENYFNSWLDLNDDIDEEELTEEVIGRNEISKWTTSSKEETELLFQKAGIEPIPNLDYMKITKTILSDLIRKVKTGY